MRSGSGQTRVTQLDGLRGIAALVVVACHVLSIFPGIGSVFSDRTVALSPAAAWAIFSPLHVFWNGTPAVHVFFVLSGFVLVLPFSRPGATAGWPSYYAKRLLRLYLPAWASLVVAVALIELIPRSTSPMQSPWADMYVIDPTVRQVFEDALLLLNASTINTPLWSLKWEVGFSLLLPVYVLFALRWRRIWYLKIGAAFLLTVVGAAQNQDWLSYLPIFAIGAVLGVERDRIRELTRSWPRGVWVVVAALGLFLANAEWIGREQPIDSVEAVVTLGATLIVLLFVCCGAAKRLGDSAVAQWLGRVSFSLYLVHLPILLAGISLMRSVPLPAALAVSVAVAFGAAELFFRYVELPSHRLSVAAGRAVERRIRREVDAGRQDAGAVSQPARALADASSPDRR